MSVASPTTHSDIAQLIIGTSIPSCINVYDTYTVSGFCITRAYRQRTVQARRLVSCITYSIRAVLFSFCILKCSTSFPKALQCLSAISCSKLSCMTRTIDISINVATSTCIKPGVCLAVFKTTVIFLQSLGSY